MSDSGKYHKQKKQHLFKAKRPLKTRKSSTAVQRFYEESHVTHTDMDAFNKEVNLGTNQSTRKEKEQDIFQKGAEALRNLFGGMKKKADSLARANNASLLDEDEYITGEEGLALEETERKRKLAKMNRNKVRYNALGQELKGAEKAKALLAEAEATKGGEKAEHVDEEQDVKKKTHKPPPFNIANIFRKVTDDVKDQGRQSHKEDQKNFLAAVKLQKEKDARELQRQKARDEVAQARLRMGKSALPSDDEDEEEKADDERATSKFTTKQFQGKSPKPSPRRSPRPSPRKSPKTSPRGANKPMKDVFAKVRDDIERKGAEKAIKDDIQRREDENEAKSLERDMDELEKKIRGAVDAEDFEAAQRMQIEMDELKAERELLRLPPAERGLRKAASRSRSNSGNKIQDFFADLGQKTAKFAGDAKAKLEQAAQSLAKPTNDTIGLVSLPNISRRASTPRGASRWETQSPMLRIAWEAVEEGDLTKLRQLFQRGVRINDARKKNTTPLHIAAARGYADVCRLLLLTKADIESQDAMGQTPMHLAVENGFALFVV
eukprot:INCI3658.4.p1 GENE.INCI3658.4~~INCI3658.4.p1  ORF type:complete len:549 (+),score=129.87 INCI3658.4:272-1918(+)